MKLNPPNAHRSQIKICEKRQTRNVQFLFMPNAFRILKPIPKSSKRVWVFRNTGANAFAKNQTCLAYEDKRDLYCTYTRLQPGWLFPWPVPNRAGNFPYIAHYRLQWLCPLHRTLSLKWLWPAVSETLVSYETKPHQTLTDHRSKFAKRGKREMCSFCSCQTRFEFLSQFRKVRNAFECFVTQVQTRLPKTKRVWPMKINVICTVHTPGFSRGDYFPGRFLTGPVISRAGS